jgi:hypothetical protein
MNNDPVELKQFSTSLAMNVPTLLVCLVAGVVILGRWREGSSASVRAALGFGIVLVLYFVIPLAQTMIQQLVLEPGQLASRMWTFTAFGIVGSVLHVVIYTQLLAAIYAGRPKASPSDRGSLRASGHRSREKRRQDLQDSEDCAGFLELSPLFRRSRSVGQFMKYFWGGHGASSSGWSTADELMGGFTLIYWWRAGGVG